MEPVLFALQKFHACIVNVPEIWYGSKMDFTRFLCSVKPAGTSGNEIKSVP